MVEIPALRARNGDAVLLAHTFLRRFAQEQKRGAMVSAWNGLSFDLRWLGAAANDVALAREVALELYDPMFQFFILRGFPIGLAAVADGLGIVETKLMHGADAPNRRSGRDSHFGLKPACHSHLGNQLNDWLLNLPTHSPLSAAG